jgi:hypothetical protein
VKSLLTDIYNEKTTFSRDHLMPLFWITDNVYSKYHNLYSTSPCLMWPIFRTPFNGRYRQVWLYP